MIDRDAVVGLVERWLADKEYFLVDVSVGQDNRIVIEIDHADGVWIDDCVQLSRFVEESLDREKEDFELEVGSAGLGQPFKVPRQYVNCIGKEVEVMDSQGRRHRGLLKEVNGAEFVVTVREKARREGSKRPVQVEVDRTFSMDEVKYTKYIISFK